MANVGAVFDFLLKPVKIETAKVQHSNTEIL